MVKDFKYILKRILIGVGIVLVLSFIRGNLLIGVNALSLTMYDDNYRVVGSCNNCTEVYPNDSIDYVRSIYITYDDVPVVNGIKYSLETTFNLFSKNSSLTYNTPTFFINSTSQSINQTYFQVNSNTQVIFPDSTTGYKLNIGYIGDFTASRSGTPLLEISFANRIITSGFQVTTRSFTYNGDSSVDAIGNASSQIINNNNNNTNNIINNNNSNTQEIIDNQNENTEKEIESQRVCNNYDKNSISTDNNSLGNNGQFISSTSFGITNYLSIYSSSEITFTRHNSAYYCYYDVNKTLISCSNNYSSVSIPSTASYVRFSIYKPENRPLVKICFSGNQAIVDSNNQLNDSITDTSGGEVSSSWFDDFRDDSNSPVSDLLTMPITLLQAYVNGFSGTCQSMNLGALYGTYIIIPCINIEDYIGSGLWNTIDVLFCIFMVYNIAMLCIHIYEGITSLDDSMQYLYSPQHAASPSSRVERNSDLY